MTVKEVVGWERNGEKCPAGWFHSYLWARKRNCKSSNPNFIFHLTCVSTSCLILAFLCSLTHNSSCCPPSLLQVPITPTHAPLCQLVSQLPHSVTLPLSTKQFPMTLLSSLPVLFFPLGYMPCSSPVAQPLSQTTTALCHLGPFSLAQASPPLPFAHFTNLVLPISRVWPSLLRLCSSLESSHIFLYWFILQSGGFSISPPPPAWMPAEGAVCTVPRVLLLSAWHLLLQIHGYTTPSAEMGQHSYPLMWDLAVNSVNLLVLAKQSITVKMSSHDDLSLNCTSLLLSSFILSLFFLGERDKI